MKWKNSLFNLIYDMSFNKTTEDKRKNRKTKTNNSKNKRRISSVLLKTILLCCHIDKIFHINFSFFKIHLISCSGLLPSLDLEFNFLIVIVTDVVCNFFFEIIINSFEKKKKPTNNIYYYYFESSRWLHFKIYSGNIFNKELNTAV